VEDAFFGQLEPLPYASESRWLAPPARAAPSAPVTLVTQCSLDRLPQLRSAIEAWRGPVSVAVYIEHPEGSAAADQDMEILRAELRTLDLGLARELVVSLLFRRLAGDGAEEQARPTRSIIYTEGGGCQRTGGGERGGAPK